MAKPNYDPSGAPAPEVIPEINTSYFSGEELSSQSLPLWKSSMLDYIPGALADQEIAAFKIALNEPDADCVKTNMVASVESSFSLLVYSANLIQLIKDALIPLYSYISLRWRTQFRNPEWNAAYVPPDICYNNDLRYVAPLYRLPQGEEVLPLFEFTATEIFGSYIQEDAINRADWASIWWDKLRITAYTSGYKYWQLSTGLLDNYLQGYESTTGTPADPAPVGARFVFVSDAPSAELMTMQVRVTDSSGVELYPWTWITSGTTIDFNGTPWTFWFRTTYATRITQFWLNFPPVWNG